MDINAAGNAARFVHCDVANEGNVAAAVDATVAAFGGLVIVDYKAAVINYGRRLVYLPRPRPDGQPVLTLDPRAFFLAARTLRRDAEPGAAPPLSDGGN